MTEKSQTNNSLEISSQQDLFDWLSKNYNQSESVWLVYPKKSKSTDFGWSEIVDILLCFGWIDSQARKFDQSRNCIRISPRSPKSNWSKINKDKVQKLEESGLIQTNGYKAIELAKQNGTWNALDDVENLVVPADLETFLTRHNLLDKWESKSRSYKRSFLEQLLACKKAETRCRKFEKLEL